ncbi:MAG: GNAT family N-acetyltransferase [Deltaproteobacteria bacterium]|nr:GNAT family N-acetyltransferase [Deltaproteobacteria bacterium]
MVETAINLLAWQGKRVIGHAALIKDLAHLSGEFVIFVHQDYRNLGIGTELTRITLKKAEDLDFKSVWLTVSITNVIASRLYRRVGFEYCDMDECERTMIIKL